MVPSSFSKFRITNKCFLNVSFLYFWCARGYRMSWRLAFDSPAIHNKQQTTNNQPSANTHDTKTNKPPTTHPRADTGATTSNNQQTNNYQPSANTDDTKTDKPRPQSFVDQATQQTADTRATHNMTSCVALVSAVCCWLFQPKAKDQGTHAQVARRDVRST